ncbi:MAG: carboxyltransferase domain-containing protein, partial [Bacillota bacterium]|nr:carboxyltransferase domain-containing protein [Bacillota bacterium]
MVRYLMAGDSHLVVEFGQIINLATNQQVHALASCLTEQKLLGLKEVVPTYRSLLVSYDPLVLPMQALKEHCDKCISRVAEIGKQSREIVTIPTLYGGQYGVDLAGVAREVELSEQDVIDIHTSVIYPIYMIGF